MTPPPSWDSAEITPLAPVASSPTPIVDWRTQIKPIHALGKIEAFVDRIAAIRNSPRPSAGDKRLLLFFGDHGVATEGVSLMHPDATAKIARAVAHGSAVISVFARYLGLALISIDVGIRGDVIPGILDHRVADGTANFAYGPAMTATQCHSALQVGFDCALAALADGCDVLGIGEVGIGNTTSASALFSALCALPPQDTVGRGTGVNDSVLQKKVAIVERAIAVNTPHSTDPLDCLRKLGGLEIAAMAGAVLAGASRRVPIVIDGFVATVAALLAVRLQRHVQDYLLISHLSGEQAHRKLLHEMACDYFLDLGMRLGEGTGAALAMSLLDLGCRLTREVGVFFSPEVTS